MMMRISIDSTANYIQLWGRIYIARGQNDGGDVASESGEIRWALFVERPQISPLLQNRDFAAVVWLRAVAESTGQYGFHARTYCPEIPCKIKKTKNQ
jgi:hypothetical protein